MTILHTADWHLGQLFHEYDRTYEHNQFLNWLVQTIKDEKIDVLLITGDIFDLSNPAATSVKMFYTFLNKAVKANADIQIIIIAGNHDSAARLESPKPLLESSNIHIVGLVERTWDGDIDYEKMIIPIKDKNGTTKIWCMAVPFLRMGDYPLISGNESQYSAGVASLYQAVYDQASSKCEPGQCVIALGHLHALNAEVTDLDKTERLIMGGLEYIALTAFHENIKYVGLGHIHKAQKLGGKENIRYSGSPIPMSFSELNYRHQVTVFEIIDENLINLRAIEIPLSVPLHRCPETNKPIQDVLLELNLLPEMDINPELMPFLEVMVLLEVPEPALRHKIENSLVGKKVRLAKINVKYPGTESSDDIEQSASYVNLQELNPKDVFSKIYQSIYNTDIPTELMQLFNQVTQEVNQNEQ